MRHKLLIPVLVFVLALVPVATAQRKPPKNQRGASVTLDARPATVVFSSPTELSGRVSGGTVSGVTIRLEADDTRPYGDSYKPANLTARTANNGRWSITLKPLLNTQYRVIAQTSPPVTSNARLVLVRPLVGIKLSDSTPSAGSLVRFSGSVFPPHDGRPAQIQRRSPTGRWVTVARTTLADAGTVRSTYRRSVRVRSDGVYRVKVPGDSDHVNGFSRERRINVS